MEHAQSRDHGFSWRRVALAVGIVLAMALAVVGGVVLLQWLERTRPVTATGRVPTSQVAAPTSQAAAPLRPRSRTPVLVLNGNGTSGAAGDEAARLRAHGYRHTGAGDAATGYATSLVLFRPGWQGEAERLAHDAGIRTVAPLDGSLPPADAGYQLVVILGTS